MKKVNRKEIISMCKKMIIRNSTEQDIDAICEIAVKQWSAIYVGYAERLGQELYDLVTKSDPLGRKEAIIRELAGDREHCIVTEIDGKVVAFAHYLVEEVNGNLIGELGNNAVSADYKGRGIAGKQYDVIFERMKALGCVAVKVHTGLDDGHAAARRAYEKAGFEKNLPSVMYYKKL